MLVRRSSKGKKIYIFKPRTKENVSYKFSKDETVSFDAQNKSYIVTSDGAVVKRTDSWITAQSAYDDECKKHYDDTTGILKIGKHTLVDGVAKVVK
tara:strand:+ start:294 stop:581 length:288 start_codon:yes stop_codon:yes gene_type:complete